MSQTRAQETLVFLAQCAKHEGGAGWHGADICPAGPNGIGDHRTAVADPEYVGHGSTSPEASSDTRYLYRAAPVSESTDVDL